MIDRAICGEPVSTDKKRGNMKIWNAKRVSSSLLGKTKGKKIRSVARLDSIYAVILTAFDRGPFEGG